MLWRNSQKGLYKESNGSNYKHINSFICKLKSENWKRWCDISEWNESCILLIERKCLKRVWVNHIRNFYRRLY
jgi:hypothetical protein